MSNVMLDRYARERMQRDEASRQGYDQARRGYDREFTDANYDRRPTAEYNPESMYTSHSGYDMHRGPGLYGYYGNTPFEIMKSGYPYDRRYDQRYDQMYDRRYDSRYDYRYDGHNMKYIPDHELRKWGEKLTRSLDEKDRDMLKKETILKKAEEMGIKFEKFIPEEFYVTVLMVYTDFGKTIGSANLDMYIRLAKDWLCDEDAGLQYGEKLSAYYYHVVNA